MKIRLFILACIISCFCIQSCRNTEKEEVYGVAALAVEITIFDKDGNCLLDPEFPGNIVSGNVKMTRNGKTYPFIKYTDEDYLWTGAVPCLRLRKVENRPHSILPIVFRPDQWFENETMIIEWGGDIENDTIVFTGGGITESGGTDYHLTVNGVKLNHHKNVEDPFDINTYLYIKDMSPKK